MNTNEKKIYKFHLRIDTRTKKELKSLTFFGKNVSFSFRIKRILTLFSPWLEKKHLENKQEFSRYELICENKEIPRENIYVNLTEKQYRQLKLLHQDLNFYSMAQLLRLVLHGCIALARELGDSFETKLLEIYLEWKKNRDAMKYCWKPITELLFFIYQKPRQSRFLTLYSKKFQPISIYRL